MLGIKNWEHNFDTLLHLVNDFTIAVWAVQKLYGDDSYLSISPQPEIGVLLLELGVGLVSQVNLISHMVRMRAVLCMLLYIVFVICVTLPTLVGALSVLLGQLFGY